MGTCSKEGLSDWTSTPPPPPYQVITFHWFKLQWTFDRCFRCFKNTLSAPKCVRFWQKPSNMWSDLIFFPFYFSEYLRLEHKAMGPVFYCMLPFSSSVSRLSLPVQTIRFQFHVWRVYCLLNSKSNCYQLAWWRKKCSDAWETVIRE